MKQNSLTSRLKSYAWPLAIGVVVTITTVVVSAIVLESPRVASPVISRERLANPEIPAPPSLAPVLLAPEVAHGAFDTPFFNGKKEPVTLKSFKGQGVVLDFWATWCAPCVREMPALANLAAKLAARGVRVVAISEDRKALDLVPPFYADKGIKNLELYYDVKSHLSRTIGVEGLPTTVLISADGHEIGRVKGALEWDASEIVEFLATSLRPKP